MKIRAKSCVVVFRRQRERKRERQKKRVTVRKKLEQKDGRYLDKVRAR